MKFLIIMSILLSFGLFAQEGGRRCYVQESLLDEGPSDPSIVNYYCCSAGDPQCMRTTPVVQQVDCRITEHEMCNSSQKLPSGSPQMADKPEKFKVIEIYGGRQCYLRQGDDGPPARNHLVEYFCCSKEDPKCRRSNRKLNTQNCMITDSEICARKDESAPIVSMLLEGAGEKHPFCDVKGVEDKSDSTLVSYTCCPEGMGGCANMFLETKQISCPMQENLDAFNRCLLSAGIYVEHSPNLERRCSQIEGARCLSLGCGFENNNNEIKCPSGKRYSKAEQGFFSSFLGLFTSSGGDEEISKCSLDSQEVHVKCPSSDYELVSSVEESSRDLVDEDSSAGDDASNSEESSAAGRQ